MIPVPKKIQMSFISIFNKDGLNIEKTINKIKLVKTERSSTICIDVKPSVFSFRTNRPIEPQRMPERIIEEMARKFCSFVFMILL